MFIQKQKDKEKEDTITLNAASNPNQFDREVRKGTILEAPPEIKEEKDVKHRKDGRNNKIMQFDFQENDPIVENV